MADQGVCTVRQDVLGVFILNWTSTAGGVVEKAFTVGSIRRLVNRMVTVPDATDAPTDNYDVTIEDKDGIDIFGGAGADRDTANAEEAEAGLTDGIQREVYAELTLKVAAAGDTKKGQVTLYLE